MAGFLRADIWRRYGALGTVGKSASALRTEIVKKKIYDTLHIDGTIRAETTKDIVNDILTYKEAAKLKVRQAIAKRVSHANGDYYKKRDWTLLAMEVNANSRVWVEPAFVGWKPARLNLAEAVGFEPTMQF